MTNVIACIDRSKATLAVCDGSGWAAEQLNVPVTLLHVLDKSAYPIELNLSGNIGLGTREHLLAEMVELEERRGKLALEQAKYMLQDATPRVFERHPTEAIDTLQLTRWLTNTLS
jgi:hypothetical protein